MTVTIRSLSPSDRDTWDILWRGYRTFYDTNITDAEADILWARLHDPDSGLHCLVACAEIEGNERVIGITHFLYHATTFTPADKCYLQDLFVDPEHRVGGAGRALIEAVYDAAKAHGACEVYWTTQHFNSIARVLYDRVGELTPFIKYRHVIE